MHFTVDTTHFREMVGRTLDVMDREIFRATKLAAQAGAAEAKQSTFKDRTGELRRKIQAKFVKSGHLSAVWMFVAETPYARFVEEGTQPHDIWPKAAFGASVGSLEPGQTRRGRGKGPHEHVVGRGQALRWKDEGGEQHFARVVHHPGTPAFKYMFKGEQKAEAVLYRDLHLMVNHLSHLWAA